MLKLRLLAPALFVCVALFIGLAGPGGACAARGLGASPSSATSSREEWQKEFDDVCSRTQDAMTFSTQELTALIQRCDSLLAHMNTFDDTQRKVYTERLRVCRGLYAYVLDSKKDEKK